jgi:shikimate kinase
MNLILLGMKHCGKTTVGRRLATELRLPFFDLEELILESFAATGGGKTSIEELFRGRGADEFYRLEAEAYGKVCRQTSAPGFVLAAGGRTPLNPLLEGALEQCGILVYINTPFTIIFDRIMAKGTSVLIRENDPEASLRQTYDERHPVYLARARLVVDGDGAADVVAGRIRSALKESINGG